MREMGHTGDQVQGRRTDDPIKETGCGYPTDTGAAVGYGGADTTGAFLADIGATTAHDSGTQGQLHHGGEVTDQIKGKLPGDQKDEHEKKGIMEKIKENLLGHNI